MLLLLVACAARSERARQDPCQVHDRLAEAVPDLEERQMLAFLGGISHIEVIDCPIEPALVTGYPDGPWTRMSLSLQTQRDAVNEVAVLTPAQGVDLTQQARAFVQDGVEGDAYETTDWLPMQGYTPDWWTLADGTDGFMVWSMTDDVRSCSVKYNAEGRMAFDDGQRLWLMTWYLQALGPVGDCTP